MPTYYTKLHHSTQTPTHCKSSMQFRRRACPHAECKKQEGRSKLRPPVMHTSGHAGRVTLPVIPNPKRDTRNEKLTASRASLLGFVSGSLIQSDYGLKSFITFFTSSAMASVAFLATSWKRRPSGVFLTMSYTLWPPAKAP